MSVNIVPVKNLSNDELGEMGRSFNILQDEVKKAALGLAEAGVESNHQSAAIVRAVIGLSNALHMPVIAEGVETEGERKFLVDEGCREFQGYLIGRPQPIAHYSHVTCLTKASEVIAAV